jgi:hypothetical protein
MLINARLKGHEFDLLTLAELSVRVIPPLPPITRVTT